MRHTLHQGSQHPGQLLAKFLPMINMYQIVYSVYIRHFYNLAMKHSLSSHYYHFWPDLVPESCWNNHWCTRSSHLNSFLVGMSWLFHTLMKLLGGTGTVIEGTGLKNNLKLETVYGDNDVVHIMSVKPVLSALRGHPLVDKCLHSKLLSKSP